MKKPAAITPILKSVGKGLGLEKEMLLYQLKKSWPELVGATLATHTTPEKLKFKTLTLLVDGPTWMHELSFLKRDMIQKINKRLGKDRVKTLQLKVGPTSPKDVPAQAPRKTSDKPLSTQARAVLQEALASVEDPPLKKVIQKAMERHLRKKEGI